MFLANELLIENKLRRAIINVGIITLFIMNIPVSKVI
nr:MAG TPA_asm: hypothetical protein [Caudoviricetes sp.]